MQDSFRLSDGAHYHRNKWGGYTQTNAVPFVYNESYARKYDAYPSDALNAIRLANIENAFAKIMGLPMSPAKVLDVGYGNGAFLDFCASKGKMCWGYDVANKKEVPLFWTLAKDVNITVDVATFHDSLEHISDLSFLQGMNAQFISVTVPHADFDNWNVSQFDTWHHRSKDEHIHHFNVHALRTCVESFGYRYISHNFKEDAVRVQPWANNILNMVFIKTKLNGGLL